MTAPLSCANARGIAVRHHQALDAESRRLAGLIQRSLSVGAPRLKDPAQEGFEVDARPQFSDDSLHDYFREDSLADDFRENPLHDIIPDDGCVSALDALERKEIISLLVERLVQLPELQKKVLAMYYYEDMPLSMIAARVSQIRSQAVAVLRKYITKLLA